MKFPKSITAPLAAAVLAAVGILCPAPAQDADTPQSLNNKAIAAMEQGQWEEGLELLTRAVNRFDKNAMILFGPQFGVTWYRKGICELKLGKWEDAAKSFETCYRKYPPDDERARGGSNIYHKRALLRWGEAAQGGEDWETAIASYKKFLEERDPQRDNFQPGSFYINMAVCHFKLQRIDEGMTHFETALKNKIRYRTPDSGIVSAFQALVDAVIESGDESLLIQFLEDNRADIRIAPHEMGGYSSLFLSLAGKAYGAEMHKIAFALYQLIPATQVMLEDIESLLERLGDRPGVVDGFEVVRRSKLESSKESLERQISSGDPNEVIQLSATAFLHEDKGNVRGAFAAYEQLELFYAESKKREAHLYNLARTASILGDVFATEKYGSRFLDDFPDSERVPAVRQLMLTSLFYGGEYEKCIEVATKMMPKLEEGTEQHDIATHVLGGSYYYTGAYNDARPLLDSHVETYPESEFRQAALYFQASNFARLQFWTKAASLLDSFLKAYPDPEENVYYPFALYDRANAHYALDELDASLEILNRLETEFPEAQILDQAFNLKGNVLQNQNERAEAEAYYLKALELAERRESDLVAAEALSYLISMLGEVPPGKDAPDRFEDAVTYADKFWEDYGDDSPYKAQVAVGQLEALRAAGRGEEALDRLRDVIADMASTPGSAGLEEAIGSYTEAYLEDNTAEELKDHYYNFPRISRTNHAANALLRIALIGVFEDQAEAAGDDEQARIAAEAGVRVLFRDLSDAFELEDLSNFILVRVGDYIRDTNSPTEALPYYEEALSRDDKSYRFPALFGRAAVLAGSDDRTKQERAIEDFKRILKDAEDRGDKDRALYRMIRTQMDMGQYAEAKENARLYLDPSKRDDNGGFSLNKPEVAMMLAQAYDNLGETNNAIAAYINVRNAFPGNIAISAPAIKRAMELFWERNQTDGSPSDRQGAYNAGRTYLDQTRRIVLGDENTPGKATNDEIRIWREVEELTKRYEANPNVKSKEQLEAEARRR
jgi:tetratricopeptide (TPR) repeat protein